MSNEISVTFNLQFEIPAGQEIKDVSVSFGEPKIIYHKPVWYCNEFGSPYVDHNGNQIELKAWAQYYIDNYGRRIEIPSIEKDRREKENQILERTRIQREQDEERRIRWEEQNQRRRAIQEEADRAWAEASHRQFLMKQHEKKIQKEMNWKKEGF